MTKNQTLSLVCFCLALIAVLFAIIGAFARDIWLASTQWVLVASLFSVWSIYFKI